MLTFKEREGQRGNYLDVMHGRKCVGYIMRFTMHGESAWRFLWRLKPDSRFPDPAPKHATREDAVAYVQAQMGGAQ